MKAYESAPKFANGARIGGIIGIVLRWKMSIYKLIWFELFFWLVFFYGFNMLYTYGLDPGQKKSFETVVTYCRDFNKTIPLLFVLGFYVTTVFTRWWGMWNSLPWPDEFIHYLTLYLHGKDPRSQLMRRTILRQVILGIVCCMRFFSSRVRKRFPSMRSLVDAGLMEEGEFQMMDVLARNSQRSMFWIPHMWAANIAHQARVENRIESDLGLRGVLDALTALRRTCAVCQQVEYVELPIVYTQVVTVATYSFYFALMLGSQFIDTDNCRKCDNTCQSHSTSTNSTAACQKIGGLNTYVPLQAIFQLVLYVGWLKVAQSLIDPYGEDESDFELNWLIDRHIKVTHVMEDGLNMNFERFTWKETFPWLFKQDWATKPKQFAFTEMINKSKKSKDPIPEEDDPNYIGPGIISTTTLYRLLKFDEAHMLEARYKD